MLLKKNMLEKKQKGAGRISRETLIDQSMRLRHDVF